MDADLSLFNHYGQVFQRQFIDHRILSQIIYLASKVYTSVHNLQSVFHIKTSIVIHLNSISSV